MEVSSFAALALSYSRDISSEAKEDHLSDSATAALSTDRRDSIIEAPVPKPASVAPASSPTPRDSTVLKRASKFVEGF